MIAGKSQDTIWHPFTQMKTSGPPLLIVRGEGTYLYTEDGRQLIDAISSWWVNLHGHAHPYINAKIATQLDKLEHMMFTNFTHEPAIDLADKLLKIAPGRMSRVFYTDNGSTTNECALKIAFQYWHNKAPSKPRSKVICFNGGYHGDTFGAMSAAGRTHYNKPFWNYLFEVAPIDPPYKRKEDIAINQLKSILAQGDVACFIFEPLIQGPGGMVLHSSEGLDALLKLCQEEGVITIADEVMTGFGRTGPLFACDVLQEKPDILCLSKGITGGYLPLGATLCTQEIFDAFFSNDRAKTFLHGHSYAGNPLACTAATANLDLLMTEHCTLQRQRIERRHKAFTDTLQYHPLLVRCHCLGTILALEYRTIDNTAYFSPISELLKQYFISKNIIVRPLGKVLYLIPPYCISDEDLDTIYANIAFTLEHPLWPVK